MASSSRTKPSGSAFDSWTRSSWPSRRYRSSSPTTNFASSSNSTFRSPSSSQNPILEKSQLCSFLKLQIDARSTSPGGRRTISVLNKKQNNGGAASPKQKKTCMCSPTTHPGSFRCALHKNLQIRNDVVKTPTYGSSRGGLDLRRYAMTKSLVRSILGATEGEALMKQTLWSLNRPSSSHQNRRREAVQLKPSRLSVMSRAED